nr:hypothetical protein CFP56_50932 [Quercus suber]
MPCTAAMLVGFEKAKRSTVKYLMHMHPGLGREIWMLIGRLDHHNMTDLRLVEPPPIVHDQKDDILCLMRRHLQLSNPELLSTVTSRLKLIDQLHSHIVADVHIMRRTGQSRCNRDGFSIESTTCP